MSPNPDHHDIRHDWTQDEVEALFALPFNDLLLRAQTTHRQHHAPNQVQLSTLLSIKTGGCPEDCAYCPQSARHNTGMDAEKLMPMEDILAGAKAAKAAGATRYCMGAAWRRPRDRDIEALVEVIGAVREEGLETCMTLGMLTDAQAARLAEAGLDYYNHNIDTSPTFYGEIITTRDFQDRLDTLESVRNAGMKVCCGGIVGMGESRADRAAMLRVLATLPEHPESVPVNRLVAVAGTPLEGANAIDPLEFVRTIAVARILMPKSAVRLSAGRETMDAPLQALCFFAGANSVFYGEKLLTTGNPEALADRALLDDLGIEPAPA